MRVLCYAVLCYAALALQAVANFRYKPSDVGAFQGWLRDLSKYGERRQYTVQQVRKEGGARAS